MKEISLCLMTKDLCHELFKDWENDPDIYMNMESFKSYQYNKDVVDNYFETKQNSSRVLLAILKGNTPIGEIQLKQIDQERKRLSILSL